MTPDIPFFSTKPKWDSTTQKYEEISILANSYALYSHISAWDANKKCARIAHYTALRSHFLVIVMLIIYLCREQKPMYIWKRILLLFQMRA